MGDVKRVQVDLGALRALLVRDGENAKGLYIAERLAIEAAILEIETLRHRLAASGGPSPAERLVRYRCAVAGAAFAHPPEGIGREGVAMMIEWSAHAMLAAEREPG